MHRGLGNSAAAAFEEQMDRVFSPSVELLVRHRLAEAKGAALRQRGHHLQKLLGGEGRINRATSTRLARQESADALNGFLPRTLLTHNQSKFGKPRRFGENET